jgi:DNA-binding CsgD family transcriptional regulator/tetratricopeptide (TPR) repeat protein
MNPVSPIRPDLPLIGRVEQLARLRELLGAAAAGSSATALVAGDAGVGKTRLTEEFVRFARAEGALVLIGHCVDLGAGGLPYLPFVEALGRLLREDGDETETAAGEVVREVAQQRPVLLRLAGRESAAAFGEEQERLPLYDAVSGLLAELARPGGPVVLVLEDLHWADASSRDLLRFLVSRHGRERLLVVGTYRGDDVHRRHPLRPLLAELVRVPGVERIELTPFDDAELGDYLRMLSGDTVPAHAVRAIARRSEGNAYFAQELLAASGGRPALPAGLADVLLARLEQLSPAAQRVARVASVAGRRVSDQLLRQAVELPTGELDEALREAVTQFVLVPDDQERYAFRHALLQEAVYGDLLPGERVRIHAAYARLLAGAGPAAAADLAQHCLASHDLVGALRAAVEAGAEARRRLAPAEALDHDEVALQLWDAVPAAERPEGTDLVELTLKASVAAGSVGELHRAVALATSARDLALDGSDPEQLAKAHGRLAHQLYAVDRSTEARDEARAAVAALAGRPASKLRVWARSEEARALLMLNELEASREVVRSALGEARELDLGSVEADLLTTLAVLDARDGEVAQVTSHLQTARQRAVDAAAPAAALRAVYNLGVTLHDFGDLDGAVKVLDEGLEDAGRAGLSSSLYGADGWVILVNCLVLAGRWEQAQEAVARGGAMLSERAATGLRVSSLSVPAARDPALALALTEELLRDTGRVPWSYLLRAARADALRWLGRPEEALEVIDEGLAELDRQEPYQLGGLRLDGVGLGALADHRHTRIGEPGDADDLAVLRRGEQLLADAQERVDRGDARHGQLGPEGRGWLARARAEHARLTGDAGAAGAWQRVLDEFSDAPGRTEQPYEVAYARLRRAEALLLADPAPAVREEARALATQSRCTADELAAAPLREAVDGLARRARLDVGAGPAAPATVLTAREQEVMRLVAQGLTNRQIGRRLFISEKTASVHVSNVLAKLGASGRTEAVVIAQRRDLLGA